MIESRPVDELLDRIEARVRATDDVEVVVDHARADEPHALSEGAQALQHEAAAAHGGDEERLDRQALRRVAGLSTELEDVSEVEYRRLRLENVVLIGVYTQGDQAEAEHSLAELAALAETAGSRVLDALLQRRPTPDPSTYLGRGRARELRDLVAELGADTVIADTELAPSQRRALEDVVRVKVVDRTALILDIFAQHAKSREAKAQVELAQLEYMLPRLRGWGGSLSRQAGGRAVAGEGIGSRGPGETKIELDRRAIHTRMARLRRQIRAMGPAREAKRANRVRHEIPSAAIIGYTNAGKSSLLNRLTGSDELVENRLFATLDATVRRREARDGRVYTLSDTVGFVRRLPHQLVEAFRSTFEEARDADLLVHVVDASHPDPAAQIAAVRGVLAESGLADVPELLVFNKVDLVDAERRMVLRGIDPDASFVSTRTGEGIAELTARIEAALPDPGVDVDVVVPYEHGELVSSAHEHGRVSGEEYLAEGTRLRARVSPGLAERLHAVAVAETPVQAAAEPPVQQG